ncbi:MAG: STAS domain-containing protein [Phycisphaerae bacterium]|nr:STAS domain-containing protein [Phycisphaerae bacterium]
MMDAVVKEVRKKDQAVIVETQGEIDLRHSPQFHKALVKLCEERPPILVIHLGKVAYMDSSGVGTLVEVFRRVKDYGGRLVLVAPSERVRSVFEITRLDQFFTIKDSEAEALAVEGGGA